MTQITARFNRVSDTEFELYWDGSLIGATEKQLPPDKDPDVPGDFAVELVDYAESVGTITELRYLMAGGVTWQYTDER